MFYCTEYNCYRLVQNKRDKCFFHEYYGEQPKLNMIDPKEMGKGGIPDTPDKRDFRSELVMEATSLPREYSVKQRIARVENQGKSSSCVGQAFAYYAEVLNSVETSTHTQLSARDIYSLIYFDTGGALVRDGAKKLTESGIALETDVESYEQGKPPTEAFMRSRDGVSKEDEERGMAYWVKSYVKLPERSFDAMKQAIFQNNGCVTGARGDNEGWETKFVKPGKAEWGHAFFCTGWKVIDGKEYIEFVNSWGDQWGEGGYGYISKDYFESGMMFSPWTLVDLPNDTYPKMQHQVLLAIEAARKLIEAIKKFLWERR